MERGKQELQTLLIFSIMVAGKTAKVIEKQCYDFFVQFRVHPFETIQNIIENNVLDSELRKARTGQYAKFGQYAKLFNAFHEVVKLDVNNITLEELENIKGVGKKTSRYFLMYAFDRKDIAAIDTHIEKWLREQEYQSSSKKEEYEFFERAFLEEAYKRNMEPKDLDKDIWLSRARK